MRYILYRLHFKPASIIASVKGMMQLTQEQPKSPREAFEILLLAWLLDISNTTAVACFDFVKWLQATFASDRANAQAPGVWRIDEHVV